MRTTVVALAVCLVVTCIPSCATRRDIDQTSITPEAEVLSEASRVHFPYLQILRRAERGDSTALRQLIEFSVHTDGAGGLEHGWVLEHLQKIFGRARFERILASATPSARKITRDLIGPP